MHTFVVPERNGSSIPDPNNGIVEINMLAANRTDILLLFLRVIRYLFQNGVAGEHLIWSGDEQKTKIWIENMSPEIFSDDNKRPALFIDVGDTNYADAALLNNRSQMDGKGNYAKYSKHDLSVFITVIGRNKIETHKIAERLGASLYLIKEQILEHTVNLESIGTINVGRVTQLRVGAGSLAGDTTLAFTSSVTFRTTYYLEFPMMQLGDLFTSENFKISPTSKDGKETYAADLEIDKVFPNLINKL